MTYSAPTTGQEPSTVLVDAGNAARQSSDTAVHERYHNPVTETAAYGRQTDP
ncbi:hypothetical protein AB0H94_35145 [Streptomyces purpurascens]|uniref:hypothetical protein n=1 Tax=Streptomyces purpurascens TaxID=1924 RepID=UPI0033DF7602